MSLSLPGNCFGSVHRFAAQIYTCWVEETGINLDFCIKVHAVADICDDVGAGGGMRGTRDQTHTILQVTSTSLTGGSSSQSARTHEHIASLSTLTGDNSQLMFKMVQGCHCAGKGTLGYLGNQKVRPY